MKAHLKNYRQTTRKVTAVASTLKGRRVSDVLVELPFVVKKASGPLHTLVASAFANVRQHNPVAEAKDFVVASVVVNKGSVFTRFRAQSRGRAAPIKRESSHITVVLAEKPVVAKAKKPRVAKKVS